MTDVVEGRISVVIPVFDMGRYLPEAVASIDAQRHDDIEIIVVDDGSADDTPEVIASLGDRVIALAAGEPGPVGGAQRGPRRAAGDLIAFCDADDLWPEGKLATQLARLEAEPDLDAVLGRIQSRRTRRWRGARHRVRRPGAQDTEPRPTSGVASPNTSAYERIGGFDEELRYSEDVDWCIPRGRRGSTHDPPRHHADLPACRDANIDRVDEAGAMPGYMLAVLKRSLDRRLARPVSPATWLPGGCGTWANPTTDGQRHDPRVQLGEVHPRGDWPRAGPDAELSKILVVDDGSTDATIMREPLRCAGTSAASCARRDRRDTQRGDLERAGSSSRCSMPTTCGSRRSRSTEWRCSNPGRLDIVFASVDQFCVSPELDDIKLHERQGLSPTGRIASTLLIRADVAPHVGPFCARTSTWASSSTGTDRASQPDSRVDHVDAVLVRRRIHATNTGRGDRLQWTGVVKDMLDRRRAAGGEARDGRIGAGACRPHDHDAGDLAANRDPQELVLDVRVGRARPGGAGVRTLGRHHRLR